MDKYIHDESKQDTVSLGDMLKDKIKGYQGSSAGSRASLARPGW